MKTDASPLLQIVIAEDNPGDVILVRMALRDAGLVCALTVLEDGDQAIRLIEQLDTDPKSPTIDLLLLDLHLPKREGGDILKRLRSTERNAQTSVIVMTASVAPHDYEMAQKHAAIHFQKPTTLAEFMQLGLIARSVLDRKMAGEKLAVEQSQGGAA